MLIDLINKEEPQAWSRIIFAAAISGAGNAATLAIVNHAAQSTGHASTGTFFLFIVALVAFVLGMRYSVGRASKNIELALCRLRIDLASWIRRSELLGLEQIGTAEIYERVTDQTSILSNSAWPLALGLQGAVMLCCTIVYIAAVSPEMLGITLGVYSIGALYHQSRQPRSQKIMQTAAAIRMQLFERLNDLIHGFKEVRLRTQRSDELHADFKQVATSLKDTTVASNLMTQENFVFAQILQQALMGTAVFILPQFVSKDLHTTMASISALLLILGPMSQVLFVMPMYERADLAAQNIVKLRDRLQASASPEKGIDSWAGRKFSELRLEKLEFCRQDRDDGPGFAVGPVDLTVSAGEVVFIVGGNGSGKTTLLRAMTALYPPSAGRIYVDDIAVEMGNVQAYREMITAIFSDFHLFRKLYGLSGVGQEEILAILKKMQLDHKTNVNNGEWKTINLSTGQRKRLAMVTALLEDRPIYVFDEWAADQDPEFRQFFYEELLVDLKKRGKAVIAISHDDRYFRCADKVVTLEVGKVVSVKVAQTSDTASRDRATLS